MTAAVDDAVAGLPGWAADEVRATVDRLAGLAGPWAVDGYLAAVARQGLAMFDDDDSSSDDEVFIACPCGGLAGDVDRGVGRCRRCSQVVVTR